MATTTSDGFADYHDEHYWHVYPTDDEPGHVLTEGHDCHCEPRIILEQERRIAIHLQISKGGTA